MLFLKELFARSLTSIWKSTKTIPPKLVKIIEFSFPLLWNNIRFYLFIFILLSFFRSILRSISLSHKSFFPQNFIEVRCFHVIHDSNHGFPWPCIQGSQYRTEGCTGLRYDIFRISVDTGVLFRVYRYYFIFIYI